MLAISHGAAEVIKQLVLSAQVLDEGGIRISAQPIGDESVRLELSLATSPEPRDTIVEQEGGFSSSKRWRPFSMTRPLMPLWSTTTPHSLSSSSDKSGRVMDNQRTSIRASLARTRSGGACDS